MKKRETYTLPEAIGVLLLLLFIWEIAARIVQMPILPPPMTVLKTLGQILPERLILHIAYSLGRLTVGMSLAILLGSLLGYTMGLFPRWDRLLSPVLYFTYPIPKVALLPAVMLLCGLGLLSKILMIILIVIFQIILTVRDAVQNLPVETFELLHVLGASRWQIFREAVFPASLPELLTAIRLALGTAISILFFTETYGTHYGIGYFIMDAWMRMNYPEMYAGIVLLSLCGFLLFLLIDKLQKICCRWQQNPIQ